MIFRNWRRFLSNSSAIEINHILKSQQDSIAIIRCMWGCVKVQSTMLLQSFLATSHSTNKEHWGRWALSIALYRFRHGTWCGRFYGYFTLVRFFTASQLTLLSTFSRLQLSCSCVGPTCSANAELIFNVHPSFNNHSLLAPFLPPKSNRKKSLKSFPLSATFRRQL